MEQLEFDYYKPVGNWRYLYLDVIGETHALDVAPREFNYTLHGYQKYLGALWVGPGPQPEINVQGLKWQEPLAIYPDGTPYVEIETFEVWKARQNGTT